MNTSKANVINDEMNQLQRLLAKYHNVFSLITLSIALLVFAGVCGCALKPLQKPAPPVTEKCQEVRGAMDVGSGSTKIKIAVIDTCKLKILKVIAEDQVAIAFKDKIDADGNLPIKFITEAADKITALANHATKSGLPLRDLAVIATQAARDARNIGDLKALLASRSLSLQVISQQEEAEIGHLAAALASKLNPKEFTSLDIGGGSFQLVNEDGGVKMLGGQLASVSFKNHVLTKIQNRPIGQSPNPIQQQDATTAVQHASEYAGRLASSSNEFKIKKLVVGIGGVLGSSIRNQMRLPQGTAITTEALKRKIPQFIRRTPKELNGPYADTESTNLLLVLGLMKGFGINQIQVYKANLTDGMLVSPQFFRLLEK